MILKGIARCREKDWYNPMMEYYPDNYSRNNTLTNSYTQRGWTDFLLTPLLFYVIIN